LGYALFLVWIHTLFDGREFVVGNFYSHGMWIRCSLKSSLVAGLMVLPSV
jgi:hypothetical protein